MLIAELRGSIVTIRSEVLSNSYFDEIQEARSDLDKSLSELLIDQDIGLCYTDFNKNYHYKGLLMDKKGQLIVTGFEEDSYYEEGYSFFRAKLNQLDVKQHSYVEFGWPGDQFLVTVEYEIGLFKQMKIDSDMSKFNVKSLTVNSSTFLFKPTIKTITDLSYQNRKLIEEKDFGYEKKGLFAAIVSPKKSLVFNKTIYRNFIDSSYSTIK